MVADRDILMKAILVGVLYIVATVAGVLRLAPMGALLEGSGIHASAAANRNQMMLLARVS